mgnify:CR=1 FL=1
MKARFDLLDSVDSLLERPNIHDEIEKKFSVLLASYGNDLSIVQDMFLTYRDEPTIAHNYPPIAGAISWCKGLLFRIINPMSKLSEVDEKMMEEGLMQERMMEDSINEPMNQQYMMQQPMNQQYMMQQPMMNQGFNPNIYSQQNLNQWGF